MIFRGSQVLMVLAFFVALILVGTIGYELIEGWNWADAFYMTIITITAVGYHEVHPLTETGRYWTVFMLIGGITGLGMWFALVTASMLRMDLRNTYKRRKIMKRLGRIKDHVIVCGGVPRGGRGPAEDQPRCAGHRGQCNRGPGPHGSRHRQGHGSGDLSLRGYRQPLRVPVSPAPEFEARHHRARRGG